MARGIPAHLGTVGSVFTILVAFMMSPTDRRHQNVYKSESYTFLEDPLGDKSRCQRSFRREVLLHALWSFWDRHQYSDCMAYGASCREMKIHEARAVSIGVTWHADIDGCNTEARKDYLLTMQADRADEYFEEREAIKNLPESDPRVEAFKSPGRFLRTSDADFKAVYNFNCSKVRAVKGRLNVGSVC